MNVQDKHLSAKILNTRCSVAQRDSTTPPNHINISHIFNVLPVNM